MMEVMGLVVIRVQAVRLAPEAKALRLGLAGHRQPPVSETNFRPHAA